MLKGLIGKKIGPAEGSGARAAWIQPQGWNQEGPEGNLLKTGSQIYLRAGKGLRGRFRPTG
jgi:hypothetical protein